MTGEEMQRTMQFILEQQAQFVTNIRQLNDAQMLNEQRFGHLSNIMLEWAEAQTRSEEKIASLAEAQQRTEEKLVETDERLNSLIMVVEQYISEKRNGNSQS